MGGFLILALIVILVFYSLYSTETEKNKFLLTENQKTTTETQGEAKKLKDDLDKEHEKNLVSAKKLLDEIKQLSDEKEQAILDLETAKKRFSKEQEFSQVANEDMNKLQTEVAKLRSKGREDVEDLEKAFKKKIQTYETRILTLEASLEKAQKRLSREAERYHFNLGVLYSQNKDFDSAVTEFKTTLGYNPQNALAHYNLGIIYDDYFKDKDSAKVHYRSFLELNPTSEDAEAVREWLANLEK